MLQDFRLAFVIIASIVAFIAVYTMIGYYLYRFTAQNAQVFTDLTTTYYNLYILFTTANFPDVMFPIYNVSYASSVFFISFLLFGLYFIVSLLTANIFTTYKTRIEQ